MCVPLTIFKTGFSIQDMSQGCGFLFINSPSRSFSCPDSPLCASCCGPTITTCWSHSSSTYTKYTLLPFTSQPPFIVSQQLHHFLNLLQPFFWTVGRRGAASSSRRQTQSVAVVSQPQPVPIIPTSLIDAPGLIRCPHCYHLVTTKVTYKPGWAAWCSCTMLALTG